MNLETPSGADPLDVFGDTLRVAAIDGFAVRTHEGWRTQAETATRLTISPMSVSRLVFSGVLPSEQPGPGLPTVIQESDLSLPTVQSAVHTLKSYHNRPLPADPKQTRADAYEGEEQSGFRL